MPLPIKLENFKINKEDNLVIISVKTDIYPLEVIYSAAYMFLDKNYVLIDGDPKKEVLVQFKSKENNPDFEKLIGDFNNELINYSVYAIQAARTSAIREAIVKRALGTIEEEVEKEEDLWVKDSEGIGEPWKPEKAEGIEKIEEE